MKAVWKLRLATVGLAGALLLGACGGDSSGPKSATTINQSQAAVVGDAAAAQIGSLAAGLTTFNSPAAGGLGGGFFAPQAVSGRFLAATIGRRTPRCSEAWPCWPAPTVSRPSPTGRTPTAMASRTTIRSPSRRPTAPSSTASPAPKSLWGAASASRIPTTRTPSYGYAIGFTGFGVTLTDTSGQSPDLSTSLNGSFGTDVGTANALATQNLRSSFRVGTTTVFADAAVWTLGYTPTNGVVDPAATQLPAGGINVNGSYSFSGDDGTGNTENWSFGVRTNSSLEYNGSCTDELSPFDSGTVDVYISANQTVGLTVVYGGCGAPVDITAYTS